MASHLGLALTPELTKQDPTRTAKEMNGWSFMFGFEEKRLSRTGVAERAKKPSGSAVEQLRGQHHHGLPMSVVR